MKQNFSVQEYRSRLFSRMFDRYISQNQLKGIRNTVVCIEGVAENYFVHVIARDEHIEYVKQIVDGIEKDYGK